MKVLLYILLGVLLVVLSYIAIFFIGYGVGSLINLFIPNQINIYGLHLPELLGIIFLIISITKSSKSS